MYCSTSMNDEEQCALYFLRDNNDNDNSLLENSAQKFYKGSSEAIRYVQVT